MIIEEKDFRMLPIGECYPQFDLELLVTIRPNGKEARQEFKKVAYGVSLERAIEMIAQFRVTSKHEDEAISLRDYFEDFKMELNSLKALLKQ